MFARLGREKMSTIRRPDKPGGKKDGCVLGEREATLVMVEGEGGGVSCLGAKGFDLGKSVMFYLGAQFVANIKGEPRVLALQGKRKTLLQ